LSDQRDEHREPLSEIIFGGYDKKYMAEKNFIFAKVIDTR